MREEEREGGREGGREERREGGREGGREGVDSSYTWKSAKKSPLIALLNTAARPLLKYQ